MVIYRGINRSATPVESWVAAARRPGDPLIIGDRFHDAGLFD